MRNIASHLNLKIRLLSRRPLFLLLVLTPDPLRNRHHAIYLQSQVDSLSVTVNSLTESLSARLDARVHPFCILLQFLFFEFVFILFICISRVPTLKLSLGVYALGTRDVTSDLVPLGFPSSHFQDSVFYLTCSHDSSSCSFQQWPCLPRFRLLGHLARFG